MNAKARTKEIPGDWKRETLVFLGIWGFSVLVLAWIFGGDLSVDRDTARDWFFARRFLESGPLQGPTSSFPGLRFGAPWTLFISALQSLGVGIEGLHRICLTMLGLAVAVLYPAGHRLAGRAAGAFAATLLLSFILLENLGGIVWDPTPMPLVSALFCLSVVLLLRNPLRQYLWASALFLAWMVQIHPVALLFVPVYALFALLVPLKNRASSLCLAAVLFLLTVFSLSAHTMLDFLQTEPKLPGQPDAALLREHGHFLWLGLLFCLLEWLQDFGNKEESVRTRLLRQGMLLGPLLLFYGFSCLYGVGYRSYYIAPFLPGLILPAASVLGRQWLWIQERVENQRLPRLIATSLPVAIFLFAGLFVRPLHPDPPLSLRFHEAKQAAKALAARGITDFGQLFSCLNSPQRSFWLTGMELFLNPPEPTRPDLDTCPRPFTLMKIPGDLPKDLGPDWSAWKGHGNASILLGNPELPAEIDRWRVRLSVDETDPKATERSFSTIYSPNSEGGCPLPEGLCDAELFRTSVQEFIFRLTPKDNRGFWVWTAPGEHLWPDSEESLLKSSQPTGIPAVFILPDQKGVSGQFHVRRKPGQELLCAPRPFLGFSTDTDDPIFRLVHGRKQP